MPLSNSACDGVTSPSGGNVLLSGLGRPAPGSAQSAGRAIGRDERITSLLPADQVVALLDASDYVGDAPERALALTEMLRQAIEVRVGS